MYYRRRRQAGRVGRNLIQAAEPAEPAKPEEKAAETAPAPAEAPEPLLPHDSSSTVNACPNWEYTESQVCFASMHYFSLQYY